MFMQATVIEVQKDQLLVLDQATRQEVLVNTPDAQRFRPGDRLRIWYNGTMTFSIPPQITAQRIEAVPPVIAPPAVPPVALPPVIFPPVIRPPFLFPNFCPCCRPLHRKE